MLIVTIEHSPDEEPAKKRVLRRLTIKSVHGTLATMKDYEAVTDKGKRAVIRGHARLAHGPWALLTKAMRALNLDLEPRR